MGVERVGWFQLGQFGGVTWEKGGFFTRCAIKEERGVQRDFRETVLSDYVCRDIFPRCAIKVSYCRKWLNGLRLEGRKWVFRGRGVCSGAGSDG